MLLKLVTRNGAFYAIGDQKYQGKTKLVDAIMADDKIRTKLETEIQSKIKDMRSGKQVLDEDALDTLAHDVSVEESSEE